MFFFGPKVLLLLKRHSLEIYYKSSEKVMEVPFHTSAVSHLEVVSRDEVIKTLVEAFKNANLGKQNVVIALSDHTVFEKFLSPKTSTNPKKELADFFHNVPLEESHIAKKIMPLKGSVLAIAANRELFQIVAEVCREFDFKVRAVVPMTLFSKLEENEKLTNEQVKHILGAEDIFKEANFLEESVMEPAEVSVPRKSEEKEEGDETLEEDDEDGEGKKTSPFVTAVITLFLLSLIIGSLFFFKIIPVPTIPFINPPPSTSPKASIEATASAQPESTSSATVQEASVSAQVNRAEVRIHVLNGSGIFGQAAAVKARLDEKGYTNVITGNIEASEASASSVVYSDKLETSVKEEISQLLDSLISGITKTDEAMNEFNVVITIGQLDGPIN